MKQSPGGRNDGQRRHPRAQSRINWADLDQLDNGCKNEIEEVSRLQADVIDKVNGAKQFVKEQKEKCVADTIIMKRDYIPHTDQNQLVAHAMIEAETFIDKHETTVNNGIKNMDKLKKRIEDVQKVDIIGLNEKLTEISQITENLRIEVLEKEKKMSELSVSYQNLKETFEKVKELQKTKNVLIKQIKRSLGKDLEQVLDFKNEALLLSFLQSIDIDEFCQTKLKPEVLLSLISYLVYDMSTDNIETKLTFILLSLHSLKVEEVPKKYVPFFKEVQQTLLSFRELLAFKECHESVLMILFVCEEFINPKSS
ncbi:hypothetical protein EIN_227710 [Entamoeba invadens IP1]|uniref:Uncharacterized protein n=1 Tax=Entamoeba invadens IP1 TaxID=370355 RepID=A0A0A1U8N6_ENTIV|nr:hypothetical protein EIN_227710 [Entamoeba invadens IP1]ELP88348.1 hypothetical protein EIN_227710 [Entamoeba invadens IP1]|eukprot:XP_004255119.1 hypothetical protein EIN_227710 [Entamoeba invadens IP1]